MKLLTYEELSNDLSLSIRYLQKCVKDGTLTCARFGKAVRFDPAIIAEWVSNRSSKAEKPMVSMDESLMGNPNL